MKLLILYSWTEAVIMTEHGCSYLPFPKFTHGLRTESDGRVVGNPYIIWAEWVKSVVGVAIADTDVTTLMVSHGNLENV